MYRIQKFWREALPALRERERTEREREREREQQREHGARGCYTCTDYNGGFFVLLPVSALFILISVSDKLPVSR